MTVKEIMDLYLKGARTEDETNQALRELGAGFVVCADKNTFTPSEIASAKAGETAEEANGFGLLDTGTGTMDKVEVRDGRLIGCDVGSMYALFLIAGKRYQVQGDRLVD